MKSKVKQLCSLVVLLVGLMVSAQAQIGTQYRAYIPFDFNVGNTTFRSGDYIIGVLNQTSGMSVLTIRAADGSEAKIIQAIPKETSRREPARLVFNRYEKRYFLAEMMTSTLGAKIRTTKDEKRVAEKQKPKRETVAIKK